MYRDDPLDDEAELRDVVGDDAVDQLLAASSAGPRGLLEVALDLLGVLQGWVADDAAARWFHAPQRRLEGQTPLAALTADRTEEVEDAARAWVAAQS